jgi:hypothetical protein
MTDEDVARGRYFAIQALRIAGVAIVLIGILIVRERIRIDPIAGYALMAAGLLDVFLVPLVLARKWRTPPE